MRTTVTIDAEVERLLRKAMHERGQTFKSVLNDALRKGLADVDDDTGEEPFLVRSHGMGLRPGIDPGRPAASADDLEADAHVDLTQRLLTDRVNA